MVGDEKGLLNLVLRDLKEMDVHGENRNFDTWDGKNRF